MPGSSFQVTPASKAERPSGQRARPVSGSVLGQTSHQPLATRTSRRASTACEAGSFAPPFDCLTRVSNHFPPDSVCTHFRNSLRRLFLCCSSLSGLEISPGNSSRQAFRTGGSSLAIKVSRIARSIQPTHGRSSFGGSDPRLIFNSPGDPSTPKRTTWATFPAALRDPGPSSPSYPAGSPRRNRWSPAYWSATAGREISPSR